MKLPQVYFPGTDDLKDVTQEWVDTAQKAMGKLAIQRAIAKAVLNLNINTEAEKLTKINIFINELDIKTI